ncbi:SLBB domain-containing protein [Marinobacter nauticus]|uniref:Protein involved in polysaccharide export with SLBB domain n=1 Tax=Marinobacter nauticus TaxID=2743 RepID=A0A368UPG6_MARNT|nr:SLBB domain-containing protein [Marinobacter nauticus]RBP69249.1 protein involved in polysaccharide export with SLBB domain [Marinobacter nauticus]RCW30728.1 protein involved in polysaccharide export with SLBB domain [Marinobacter nauticus]
MNLKKRLLIFALLLPMVAAAQSITPAQIQQFKSMPKAQQEALARQYGVDLNALTGGNSAADRPQPVQVVEPVSQITDQERDKALAEKAEEQKTAEKNNGLKPFGYDLFAGDPSTFAPVTEIPVPSDYTMGPGDVLRIQLWGKENQNLELPVSRDGTISFPDSGPLSVAGLSFDEAREQIRTRVSEQYIGVQASVSLGELRSVRVFVLGEARNPGSYTVSSLSTITNALYVSGGIKQTGSLRNVQHKRDGKLLGTLDLYELLLKGDSRNDNRLQAGDVIFIPPVGKRVGIEGEVYRPALYELDDESSLEQLVSMAGGLTPQAYLQRINIERTNEDFLRIIAEADYTSHNGRKAPIQAGDRITIPSIADITGQYVEVQGAAARTGKFAWIPGMRVSSLIKSLDADLLPVADKQYAAVVRTDPENDTISVLNLQLREAVRNPGGQQDLQLQEKDRLLFFSDAGKVDIESEADLAHQPDGKAKADEVSASDTFTREKLFEPVIQRLKAQASPTRPQQTIAISGPVRYPGEYPLPATQRLEDAIFVAGGLKDSASLYQGEIARYTVDENGVGQTRILNVNLADAMAGRSNIELQSRDRVLIKSIPEFAKTRTIELKGEVRYPGIYTFRDGETLKDVLQRAGGLTENAFPRGAVFTREKLRQLEAQRLREAEERLQGDLLGVQLEGDNFGGQTSQRIQQVEDLLEDVQNSRPVGRMVIDLAAVVSDENYQPIRLQDGDSLTIPTIPQAVSVFGEVQFPTSHLHQQGLTVDDYLERSGGPTRQADEDRVYVVKADGSVMLPERSQWFGGRSQQLQPGDTIIMPIDVDRLNQLELWTNVSQIVYQMALGAAAVGNL